jgi:hypothetical protein
MRSVIDCVVQAVRVWKSCVKKRAGLFASGVCFSERYNVHIYFGNLLLVSLTVCLRQPSSYASNFSLPMCFLISTL